MISAPQVKTLIIFAEAHLIWFQVISLMYQVHFEFESCPLKFLVAFINCTVLLLPSARTCMEILQGIIPRKGPYGSLLKMSSQTESRPTINALFFSLALSCLLNPDSNIGRNALLLTVYRMATVARSTIGLILMGVQYKQCKLSLTMSCLHSHFRKDARTWM